MKYDKLNHWYGWNGGECPVDGDVMVETVHRSSVTLIAGKAESRIWTHGGKNHPNGDIVAFRIVNLESNKPREWWATVLHGEIIGGFTSKSDAIHLSEKQDSRNLAQVIKVIQDD